MQMLVTGALKEDNAFFKQIEGLGYDITYVKDETVPLTEQSIDPSRFEAVICNSLFLHTPIEQFKKLRLVQLTGAGLDRVPIDYIKSHRIKLHNAKGVYAVPMAEYALCGVLQLYKKSGFFADNQKKRLWKKHRGLLELCGKRVCVVGCGEVGTECAKRFKAFDCEVVGVNRTVRKSSDFDRVVSLLHLDEEIAKADVIVLAVALSEETHHLLDNRRLAMIKPGALLVNISRGGLVDTKALMKYLPHMGGAVLDVFEEEPLSEKDPLWDMENVIISPHNSFVGEGNVLRLHDTIIGFLRTC